jgi:hypothetical protein
MHTSPLSSLLISSESAPNVLLSSPFSNILNPCSTLKVRISLSPCHTKQLNCGLVYFSLRVLDKPLTENGALQIRGNTSPCIAAGCSQFCFRTLTAAVIKRNASRSQQNCATVHNEQRSAGEWRQLRTHSVAKLAAVYWWRRNAR